MLKFKHRMRQKYSDKASEELNEYFNTNKKREKLNLNPIFSLCFEIHKFFFVSVFITN